MREVPAAPVPRPSSRRGGAGRSLSGRKCWRPRERCGLLWYRRGRCESASGGWVVSAVSEAWPRMARSVASDGRSAARGSAASWTSGAGLLGARGSRALDVSCTTGSARVGRRGAAVNPRWVWGCAGSWSGTRAVGARRLRVFRRGRTVELVARDGADAALAACRLGRRWGGPQGRGADRGIGGGLRGGRPLLRERLTRAPMSASTARAHPRG